MQQFLDIAQQAARAAGDLIRTRLGDYRTLQTKSSPNDLVTDVDRAAEELISRHLLAAFPGHAILGEEGMTQGSARHERSADAALVEHLWVWDPIDGTINFVHGIPGSTVAICLCVYGRPVVGVVYEPSRDEMFTAALGGGAYLSGRRIHVRPETAMGESLLSTGYSNTPGERERNLRGTVAIMNHCRNIRALGSAQLHLAYVAAGRLTGFWEAGLAPWDMAAGYVLVTEAGGSVTDFVGAPYTLETADIVASNGLIHDEFRRIVGTA